MFNYNIGFLGNINEVPEKAYLWEGICYGLNKLGIKYYFLDQMKGSEDINNSNINLLFTINTQGLRRWHNITLNNITPLVIWNFEYPLTLFDTLKTYLSRKNFFLFNNTNLSIDYVTLNMPQINKSFLPIAYNDSIWFDKNSEKNYDVVFWGKISDLEKQKSEIQSSLSKELFEIFMEIIDFQERNPGASFLDIFNYFSLIYQFDQGDIELCGEIYDKLKVIIQDTKKLKVLNSLKDFNVRIWGNNVWQKYLHNNWKYMGDVDYNKFPQILQQSKIVINIDDIDYMLGISDKSLISMASGTLLLTENNLQMQQFFPIHELDIYYNLSNISELPEKVNHYLNNKPIMTDLSKKLCLTVKQEHTWEIRMNELVSMFKLGE